MEVTYEKKDRVAIFRIKGRIDSNTSPELEKKVLDVLQNDTHDIILNFKDVDYLSSAGIRILVHSHKEIQKKGGQIYLTNIEKSIEHVLYLTGFLPYFKTFDSETEAFNALGKEKV